MYSASSIVRALRENNNITAFHLDLVICPVESCITNPGQCSKGQNQSCEKKVDIVYEHDNHNKVTVLIFRYQLNGSGTEGFIREDDFSLKVLIKREVISIQNLTTV